MTKFSIDIRALKATAIACSREETRYYLKGVCVEHSESGPIFIATDGHRLLCTRHDWESETVAHFAPVIIPAELIKRVKINKKIDVAEITLETIGTARNVRITYCGATYAENEIAGTFPNWRAVMPKTYEGKRATYNADYIVSFKDAAKIMGGSNEPSIAHNGGNPAFVNLGDIGDGLQSFGIIMPMRDTRELMTCAPDWALSASALEARNAAIASMNIADISTGLGIAQ